MRQGIPEKFRINLHHENDTLLVFIVCFIIILGLLWSYGSYKNRSWRFFVRDYFILNAHIVLKLALITFFFAAIIAFVITNIFLYKFSILEKSSLPKPNYFNPLKLIFKTLQVIPFFGPGVAQMKNLLKAQALFEQIKTTNYILYYLCHTIAVVQLLWYFFKMKFYMELINRAE